MATANSESKQKSAKFDHKKAEVTSDVNAKIAGSYKKLAEKFRHKSEHASDRLKDATNEDKRATYRRKFELYGDAATDLDERVRQLSGRLDNGGN